MKTHTAGALPLRRVSCAAPLGLAASGMLLYTVINSSGYFAELGQWPMVGMFAVLLAVAATSIVFLTRGERG